MKANPRQLPGVMDEQLCKVIDILHSFSIDIKLICIVLEEKTKGKLIV